MTDSEFGSADDPARGRSDAASSRSARSDAAELVADSADANGDALLDALRPVVRAAQEGDLPKRIRRYRIERLLGSGSFGTVYLARDHQLQRDVAIKVPSTELLSRPGQAANYLEEARTIATLEHPHIVPVYDVGSTYDFPCFIVTRYIDGTDLAETLSEGRLSRVESIQLVIAIARALHYAHGQGVVHRDVKPENILIDRAGKPCLVDLGLALTEENVGRGPRTLGTPAYMSPEQARGEGHRVDGRTDIYSLGVILYEVLLGRRPFLGSSSRELMEHIVLGEPKPPRQIDDSIPRELERICLKCLAKRAADRYSTAADLADELQAVLDEQTTEDQAVPRERSPSSARTQDGDRLTQADSRRGHTEAVSVAAVNLVPKGLRSYSGDDVDAFLTLLPGPADRRGLPDSIRFWKSQIDPQPDHGNARPFEVGVIYGPSGCGKSSLVQAGLIPRLSERVVVIFLEATSYDTEVRILEQLRLRFPGLPQELALVPTLQRLRVDADLREDRKILIVIDQFEQWLARQWQLSVEEEELTALTAALRQCDGQTLQALLLIRDDFWVSITDFMRSIEVRLSEATNLRCVSLFDEKHARRVLHLLGAAYERLPESPAALSPAQNQFLKQAVAEISNKGRTTSIKVALMAEILKAQEEWTPETLEQMGGLQGIGVRYLEQLFDESTSPPHHRRHRKSIERLLSAMLPPVGVSIRGQRMPVSRLAETCRLSSDSAEFMELVDVLDRETRIITPVDLNRALLDESSVTGTVATAVPFEHNERGYQLTHDYLVPSIRRWLRAKQSQTRSGRARLLLRERSASWNAHPQHQRLPSFLELLNIVLLVPRDDRTTADDGMLQAATKYYATRLGLVSVIAVLLAFLTIRSLLNLQATNRQSRAAALVNVLMTSPIEAVPLAIDHLHELEQEAPDTLRREFETAGNSIARLRLALALADFDDVRTDYLTAQIPTADARSMVLLIQALARQPDVSAATIQRACASESTVEGRARYLLAAMDLASQDGLADSLACDEDPTERSAWICQFGNWRHRWDRVLDLLNDNVNSDIRSAVLLGLSRCDRTTLPEEARPPFRAIAVNDYLDHPSAVVHSACRRLLDAWAIELPEISATQSPRPDDQWFISPHGHTLIQIFPDQRYLSCPDTSAASRNLGIWISDAEITVAEFQRFVDDTSSPERQLLRRRINTAYEGSWQPISDGPEIATATLATVRSANQPVMDVNVEDAILYCNWLSRREGLKSCYQRTDEILQYRGADDWPDSYRCNVWLVDRCADGYRLPSEGICRFATAGGSVQRFPFGSNIQWFEEFAVVSPESATGLARATCATVRSRLPNNYGLFDMLANVQEWTHPHRRGWDPADHKLSLSTPVHGQSWQQPVDQEAAKEHRPTRDRIEVGFRIVRNMR